MFKWAVIVCYFRRVRKIAKLQQKKSASSLSVYSKIYGENSSCISIRQGKRLLYMKSYVHL